MSDWIFYIFVFGLVVAAAFLVFRALTGTGRQVDERLAADGGDSPQEQPQMILGDITQPLGGWTLAAGDEKKKAALEQELREAGYYRPTALVEYAAVRTLLVAVPIVVALALALVVDIPLVPWML